MSELHKSAASLRVFGEDLDPDEVTALLGQPPTHSYRKGDIRVSRDGRQWPKRGGHWGRSVERRTPGDLDGQVEELLSGLTDDPAVWKTLSERFQADVYCGLFMKDGNEGIIIGARTLLALGWRNLELGFDIYGP